MTRTGCALILFGICLFSGANCGSASPTNSSAASSAKIATVSEGFTNSGSMLDAGEMPPPPRPLVVKEDSSLKLKITAAKDGSVTKVAILESSGSKVFDEIARSWAAEKWKMPRAKDGEPNKRTFAVPVVYLKSDQPLGRFPPPPYPRAALKRREQGVVVVHVKVEETGRVGSAKTAVSCGHKLLDEYAASWIKMNWEFPAGAPREYMIPVHFELR